MNHKNEPSNYSWYMKLQRYKLIQNEDKILPYILKDSSHIIWQDFAKYSSFCLYIFLLLCRGDFNLNNFEDGVLSSAFMVGLLVASPIFASLAKR